MGSYVNWYNSQNYDRVTLMLPKGSLARLKVEAEKNGVSVNEYIKGFLPGSLIAERVFKGKRGNNDIRKICDSGAVGRE